LASKEFFQEVIFSGFSSAPICVNLSISFPADSR